MTHAHVPSSSPPARCCWPPPLAGRAARGVQPRARAAPPERRRRRFARPRPPVRCRSPARSTAAPCCSGTTASRAWSWSSRAAPDDAARRARRPTDVVIILDRSGSMDGDKIVHARAAVRELLAQLDAQDRFALVTYSDDARLDRSPLPPSTTQARAAWHRDRRRDPAQRRHQHVERPRPRPRPGRAQPRQRACAARDAHLRRARQPGRRDPGGTDAAGAARGAGRVHAVERRRRRRLQRVPDDRARRRRHRQLLLRAAIRASSPAVFAREFDAARTTVAAGLAGADRARPPACASSTRPAIRWSRRATTSSSAPARCSPGRSAASGSPSPYRSRTPASTTSATSPCPTAGRRTAPPSASARCRASPACRARKSSTPTRRPRPGRARSSSMRTTRCRRRSPARSRPAAATKRCRGCRRSRTRPRR